MAHVYGGSQPPMGNVHDLARAQQQGWLSFTQGSTQYTSARQQQVKRRPLDRPRRGRRAAQGR